MSERAMESDTAVRQADLRGVLTFLQIRHGAVLSAPADSRERAVYAEARESAIREVLWRFEEAEGAQTGEVERLTKWVHDLQSGMYINCVYCGHCYGPEGDPETTMQDALTAHIRACPKHPLAKALADIDTIRTLVAEVAGADPETWPDHGNAPLAIAAWFAQLKITMAEGEADHG